MRGVPQVSVSRLPNLDSGVRWSFLPTRLTRGRRRRSTQRVGHQRQRVVRTGTQTQLSRQWLRRF